jgi:hypothetical protein
MRAVVTKIAFVLLSSHFWCGVDAQAADTYSNCTDALLKEQIATHVLIDFGNLNVKPDDAVDTLQVVLIADLPANKYEISGDGEIIYASTSFMSDKAKFDALINSALARRIKAYSGVDCSAEVKDV